ncbi:glycosyltransferase [Streptomyces sp. NBC_01264]|uniref:glycosyltransferase n=1 Tax=Streptomyces sp. NBC_01264 TaxID=2903804 RepID=UPI002257EFD8|nr:glycosyltransferase [Streptomyces sp. NBC_01264]MCX4784365.1 glycosyltransferase [Streptomyces sp. NBC_01264]
MSRFLFVVPPLVGHINPAVGVAAVLAARGHQVAWAGDPALVRRLAGPDATVHPCPLPGAGRNPGMEPDAARPADIRGPEALRFLWERFLVPLAEAMAPGVRQAAEAVRPDVVVADQQALAGALVAEDLRLTWATSATTSAELTDALASMPRVAAWNETLLRDLRARIGDPAASGDPRFSPHLVLAFSTPELAGPAVRGGDRVRWVGPSLTARPLSTPFPWERLDPRRALVLVTLGTANTDVGARFLNRAAQALRARADRVQAVIVDPEGTLGTGHGAGDVIALPVVPQLELLARAKAVVCHGGHNTVCEALWHGVPLVVAPIRDDQPVVAAQVAGAGAAVRIRFGRAGADTIGAAVDTVLDDPRPRAAARTIAHAFRRSGGAPAAATHLERLADGRKDET